MMLGEVVNYHHALLDAELVARVLSVSKRGVVIQFEDRDWPAGRRFLTHHQAREALSVRSISGVTET